MSVLCVNVLQREIWLNPFLATNHIPLLLQKKNVILEWPYSFSITHCVQVSDPKLVKILRRKVKLNQPYCGVFVKKSDENTTEVCVVVVMSESKDMQEPLTHPVSWLIATADKKHRFESFKYKVSVYIFELWHYWKQKSKWKGFIQLWMNNQWTISYIIRKENS